MGRRKEVIKITIPLIPKKKTNEWTKRAIFLGILAGLNAMLWAILFAYYTGMI